MNKLELLLAIMENREFVIACLPTKRDVEIYEFCVAKGTITSMDVRDKYKCSIQSASVIIKRLYNKGYIGRYEEIQDTGGKFFVYSSIFNEAFTGSNAHTIKAC